MQITDIETGVETLVEAIKTDYRSWMLRGDEYTDVQKRMINDFETGIGYKAGKKYIKITNNNGGSVWGFVVATDDDKKFRKGDILKAAGYNAPARNAPRGNVFDGFSIHWTGPKYL